MSNYLAIATVTAVLQRTLQASVQADVDGARVTTVRPDNVGSGTPETGINLFLYRVTPNPTWRNADLRTRSPDGQFIKRPQAALDLFYLLSCYGNEVELEPQRLMGSAIRTLHAKPVLDQASIQDAIVSANFRFLRDSNLGDQVETVKLMPLPLSTDELSNLWSVFFQTPYALSIAYQAGVVLIESDDIPRRALPVRDRYFDIIPNQPLIERLTTTKGDLQPIATDTTLVIRGQRLRYEVTEVRINRVDFVPQKVSDTEIILPLSDLPTTALQAGVQSLQVIHRQSTDAFRGIESNAVPFILRPTITEVTVSNIESESDTLRQAEVTLTLNPPIVKGQRCLLALNERTPSNPTAYTFDAIKRELAITRKPG
jgi:hypothetical protein